MKIQSYDVQYTEGDLNTIGKKLLKTGDSKPFNLKHSSMDIFHHRNWRSIPLFIYKYGIIIWLSINISLKKEKKMLQLLLLSVFNLKIYNK